MRFEAKHNYFKDLAHRIKCFKNVLKTLSEHHQQTMCYHLSSGDIFESKLSIGPCNTILKSYNNDSIITGQKKTKSTLEWGPALGFIPEMEVKRYKINILIYVLQVLYLAFPGQKLRDININGGKSLPFQTPTQCQTWVQ